MNSPRRTDLLARRLLTIAVASVALLVIAYLDRISGHEIGISLFYLVPVVGAALMGDRFSGPTVAVLAAATWFLADLGDGTYSTHWAPVWNSFTRLVYFLGSVLLVREYRAKREAEGALQRFNAELEQRVQARTSELLNLNRELESFNQSIAHDLRTPLRGIDGFSQILLEEYGGKLDERGRGYLQRVRAGATRIGDLIDALLSLSQLARSELKPTTVDLGSIADEVAAELRRREPARRVRFTVAPNLEAEGDYTLLHMAVSSLLENAWKFTRDRADAEINVGCENDGEEKVYYVRDNGAGFDETYSNKLFVPFQRLHSPREFEGQGVGLARAASIVRLHGGAIWASGEPGRGATFRFTLGGAPVAIDPVSDTPASAFANDDGRRAPLRRGRMWTSASKVQQEA